MRDDAVLGRALPLDRGLGPSDYYTVHICYVKNTNRALSTIYNLHLWDVHSHDSTATNFQRTTCNITVSN